MQNVTEHIKESRSFDSELVDMGGKRLPVDCKISLPNVWGEEVDITLAVPHSEMPFDNFENPSSLDVKCVHSDARVVIKDIWYRELIESIYPPRVMGSTNISITHMGSLCLSESFQTSKNKFFVYISSSNFFNKFIFTRSGDSLLDELVDFDCPKLGCVKLQRYWVKSLLKDTENYLLSSGYRFEISLTEKITSQEAIENLDPILDILSILLRQRIVIYGWELINEGLRTRFWNHPLEPTRTSYVRMEPECYLVSKRYFQAQVNSAIVNYYKLGQERKRSISRLSYDLSPAIDLRNEERFMSLFKGLETIASRFEADKELTIEDKLLIDRLCEVADSFRSNNPELCNRVEGIVRKISAKNLSLVEKLKSLLRHEHVDCSDLWGIDGKRGLSGIRNKLTHRGSDGVHHQGLAISVFHLSIITERFIFSLLGLTLENCIYHQLKRDEWLQHTYVRKLEDNIFNIRTG